MSCGAVKLQARSWPKPADSEKKGGKLRGAPHRPSRRRQTRAGLHKGTALPEKCRGTQVISGLYTSFPEARASGVWLREDAREASALPGGHAPPSEST